MVNFVLSLIPNEIPLGENIEVHGGLHQDPYVEPNEYLELIFDISIEDKQHPLTDLNLANFTNTEYQKDYQLQLYVSEYLLQSAISVAFYADILRLGPVVLPDLIMDSLIRTVFKSSSDL